ncbi:hypothetical protein EUX98_g2858 [Antrodiella citrinella]|uniref:CCHC-type domain-containing protein n=1 Tax=Antrodiella citrinella TaxID=2447956 RepID=A0A4S4N0T3_9APHY|nr:hypothetical protein EUX98_g2858 [Antrodiella citrinella]
MTRYTNVARKRTYVQAGFGDNDQLDDNTKAGPSSISEPSTSQEVQPDQKRRFYGPRAGEWTGEPSAEGEVALGGGGGDESSVMPQFSKKPERGERKPSEKRGGKDADARKFASEQRRVKRLDMRHADTTCFACRETGHAARDCPKAMVIVGICYRCGSKKHNLSRCPKPVDSAKPLPFASCFVCSGTGHLAGSCPKNAEKGVYPNGGSCKLCGQTSHLAKDCDLRKQEVASAKLFVGTGHEVGADEDDFHSFKRRTAEVSKEEKGEDRLKRMQAVKQGAHSGVVKTFGKVPAVKPAKVVSF